MGMRSWKLRTVTRVSRERCRVDLDVLEVDDGDAKLEAEDGDEGLA